MRTWLLVLFLASSAAAQRADAPRGGAPWIALDGGTDATVHAATTASDGSVYVGGEFTTAGGIATGPVARWDGASWHPVGALAGDVWAMAAGDDGSVLAAGYLTDSGSGQAGCAARWDGTAWEALGTTCGLLNEIYAATVLPDGTPVVGGRHYGDVHAVVRWNGESWVDFGTGPGATLRGNVWALAVAPNGRLYAGGEHLRVNDQPLSSCVTRWTGSEWRAVGTNLRSASNFGDCVLSLAFGPDGSLYAGGYFYVGDDPAIHGVARWDGSTWTAMPSTFAEPGVWALRFGSDGRLYSGRLSNPAFSVWNGSDWEALSSSGAVYALSEDATGRLLLAGTFQEMGGVASPNVIGYDPLLVSSDPPPADTPFAVYPNPTTGPATIRTAVGGRAEVLDALGRTLWAGDVAPGTTDLPTTGLAPGVYVVRLSAGDATASQRLVIGR